MLLLHTQTEAVLGRVCVCIEEVDILYSSFLKKLQFKFHFFEYTSSTITPHFVICIISVPCYPVNLYIII